MRRRRSLGLFAVGAILLGAGCGSTANSTTTASTTSPFLLTTRYIDQQAASDPPAGAARTVLEFWRDIQFSNFPSAYQRLTPDLQRRAPYERFVTAFNRALPLFEFLPRVQSSQADGSFTTVFLLLQDQSRPTPRDVPLAFNVQEVAGGWRIATDPRNVLGLAPGGAPAGSG